ncbi:MAG TPA: ParB N-terminal domain-containing protein [Firmicutes bacterium]|nr:ParB N-terminal domain-containing protein [Bacillota bacterium]
MKLRSAATCYQVPVDQIYDFPGHPFSVNYDEEMRVLEAKILRDGVQEPILLWPNEQKLYIVSGHRRRFICKKNGIPTIPAFIREMTRDEAIIAMVNGNEHREIPFTQRIKAYAMEMEAQKRQGARNDLARPSDAKAEKQPGELADIYGAKLKMSGRSFQRYMHIQYLSDDFCAMIDNNEMKGPVGIELSYLTKEQQNEVFNLGLDYDVVPSSAQAKQLHDLSESGKWTTKAAKEILTPKSREKGAAAEQAQKAVVFKSERIPLMFPPGTTQSEMESHILKILELQKLAKRKQQEEAKKPAEEKAAPPPEQGSSTVEPEKAAVQKPSVSPKALPSAEAPKPNPTAEKAEPGQKAEKPKETAAASPSPAAKDAKVVALPPAKQTEQKPKKNGPTR